MTRFSRREALKVLAGSPALLVSPAVAQDARRNPRPHNASAAPASELDFKRDFGALGDGAFDNSDAFTKFGHAARGCSKAGRAVRLRIAPGQYQYDAKKCFGFLFDIENLHIVAHGAAVQNTYDTAVANSNYEFPWPSIHSYLGGKYVINNEGALIFKATAGDQRIVLKSPAELEEVPVGAYVLIASLNIQYMGYPHNCDRFDYARVTAVDPATGAVTLDRRLKYSHLEDFPELFNRAYCSGPHVGRARIWNMNKYELHDVEHTTDGLTILPILHKNHDYQDIFVSTGRKQVYNDCTFSGYGPTNIEHFAMRNCTVRGRGEVDKLIDLIDIDGCSFESGVNFQSSSVDRVVVKKSTFKDKGNVPSVLAGTAKVLEFDACTIDTLSEGLVLGVNRRLTIKNSIIRNWGFGGNGYSQFGDMSGPLLDLDGVNASYADGVFTIVASSASILRHQCLIYNVVPGAQINLDAKLA